MKVGIITLYDYYNYGSFLQAYAMKSYLNGLGHDAVFIRTQKLRHRYRRGFGNEFSPQKVIFNTHKLIKFQRDFFKLKQLKYRNLANEVDAVIIGSDELWNADNDSFFQFPYYYGVGYAEKVPTLVYAMSLGGGDSNTLLKKAYIVPAIKKLDDIYARDQNTAQAIGKYVNREIEIVCDPTFLIDKETYMLKKYKGVGIASPYLLVYSYSLPDKMKPMIVKYAKEHNLKIISACFPLDIAGKTINCSPLEFPSVVSGASAVVTSTFHGSVFSIMFSKKLLVVPYAKKTTDFISSLMLEKHIFETKDSYAVFESILTKNIDYDEVSPLLSIQKSKDIIEHFLERQ